MTFYLKIIFFSQGSDGMHAIQTSGSGSTIVQYTTQSQDGQQFFVPGKIYDP